MEMDNSDRVGKARRLLKSGLAPFVSREFIKRYKGRSAQELGRVLNESVQDAKVRFARMDAAGLLKVMRDSWNDVFRHILKVDERNLVFELLSVRHRSAHDEEYSSNAAYRALDSTHRLLMAVSASKEADEVERMRRAVLRELAVEEERGQRPGPSAPAPAVGVASGRDGVKCIAVDWSGDKKSSKQRNSIWIAVAVNGELLCLESGHTRDEVVDILVKEVQSQENLVIGLDFAFSFPRWYLQWRKLSSAYQLWELAEREGETWLNGNTWPFWGRPGPYQSRPGDLVPSCEFRQTEEEVLSRAKGQPESVFKLVGPKQVGTGSVRGQPYLLELQRAGAAIWPFDAPKMPMVIEIYPRSLTGKVEKTDREARVDYLTRKYPGLDLGRGPAREMVESDDAFDAGVSALVMSCHAGDFARLERATGPPKSLEGEIWSPS